jgi:hypothetical protein
MPSDECHLITCKEIALFYTVSTSIYIYTATALTKNLVEFISRLLSVTLEFIHTPIRKYKKEFRTRVVMEMGYGAVYVHGVWMSCVVCT